MWDCTQLGLWAVGLGVVPRSQRAAASGLQEQGWGVRNKQSKFQVKWKKQGENGKKATGRDFSLFLCWDDPKSLKKKYTTSWWRKNPHFMIALLLQALFGSLPPEFPDASKTHLCKGRSISLTLPSRNWKHNNMYIKKEEKESLHTPWTHIFPRRNDQGTDKPYFMCHWRPPDTND